MYPLAQDDKHCHIRGRKEKCGNSLNYCDLAECIQIKRIVNIMISEHDHQQVYLKLLDYLYIKQSPNGGFGTYQNEYFNDPNLADTYFAVQLFHLMEQEIPQAEKTKTFLNSYPVSGHVHQIYYFVETLHCLNPEATIPQAWLTEIDRLDFSQAPTDNLTGWLDRMLTTIRLKKKIHKSLDLSALTRWIMQLNQAEIIGAHLSIFDTYLAFQLLSESGFSLPPNASMLVNNFQRLPSGFSITHYGSSPRLDSLYAGIGLCELIDLPVKYPIDVQDFVLACQCSNGGFSSAPAAIPSIELSFKAIWILERLANR